MPCFLAFPDSTWPARGTGTSVSRGSPRTPGGLLARWQLLRHNWCMARGAGRHDEMRETRRLNSAVHDPVILVLLLAGIFDGLSGNPVHAVLLIGVALVLGVRIDEPSTHAQEAHLWSRSVKTTWVAIGIAVVYAVAAGSFERYTWPATAVVVLPGLLGVTVAWHEADVGRPAPKPIGRQGAIAWASVFVTLGVWELINLLLQPSLAEGSYDHPTLSTLLEPLLAGHTGRSIALLLWLALGWYLVRR